MATTPISSSERIATLDVLRGVALLFVLVVNAVTEFRVSVLEVALPTYSNISLWYVAVVIIPQGKGIALLSFLFGTGLAIQFDRLAADGPRLVLLLRRMAVLLAIGLAHLVLLFSGDILTWYACAGFLSLPLLYTRQKTLLFTTMALFACYFAAPILMHAPLPEGEAARLLIAEARRVYGQGSYFETVAFRTTELRVLLPYVADGLIRTIALFLLGAWVWRSRLLQRDTWPPSIKWAAWIALVAGIVLLPLAAYLYSFLNLCLAFAYGVAIISLARHRSRLIGWIAPFGQMALTNYIMQSVVLGLIFRGYGLGLYGMDVGPCLAIIAAIFVAQVLSSRLWLDHFLFGPLEWLWRSLMYGERQPLLRR